MYNTKNMKFVGNPTNWGGRIRQWLEEEAKQREVQLESQLVIGDTCSKEDQDKFWKFLLSKHSSFAMNDDELGETYIVEHSIDTGDARPAKLLPGGYHMHSEKSWRRNWKS